ncbi:MAG: type II toxin-antitoxin system VapC family toxin [Spirochaeta sp.]|jgi:tRNA(fMet)-specific endonuclease VapC|nr:type II toxin-antitoxin system VapC family toxin [Spirochaeta sp.]
MAVDIAIDTNRYRDFVDGLSETVSVFRTSPKILIPFVVVAELRAGFAVGSRGGENERVFEQFLHRPRVGVLLPTMDTARHYANLYRQLRLAGTPIPTNDLWIAALVVEHDVMLYSRDAHFDALPQLPRVRPV